MKAGMKLALTKVIHRLANVKRMTAKSKLGKAPTMVRTFAMTKGFGRHHKSLCLVAKKNESGVRPMEIATRVAV